MTSPARPNLLRGIGAATVGALIGAVLWAVLTSVTNYKIGYAAVGVGALAGFLGGRFGGGSPEVPVFAAVIGLVGCVFGDILTDAHIAADEITKAGGSADIFKVLKAMFQHPSDFGWPLYKAGFDAIDVLFYAFAGFAAFRLAQQHGMLHHQPTAPPAPAWQPPTGEPVGEPSSPPAASDSVPDMYKKDVPPTA
jgi:hypothetical protein